MLKMFNRLHREERGFAIITAVLTSAIVVILGTTVVQLAMHNSEASAHDRRRVQAVAAAEAGLDYYMSFLTGTGGQMYCGGAPEVSKPMVGSPGRFVVTGVTFYDASGVPMPCPPTDPRAVKLVSTGYAGPVGNEVERTMESYSKLTVATGSTFDNAGAVFAQNNVTFTANATIGGQNFSDADVYTNGNISLGANSTLYGRIFAQGTLTMQSGSEIKKDVHTKGSITMASKSIIRGSAIASGVSGTPSSITLGNNSRIYNGAKASGAITGGTVTPYRDQNQTGLTAPPARSYPTYVYDASHWVGYTNPGVFADCGLAEAYIRTSWAPGTNLLVRVSSSCTLTFTTNTYNVKGNLAIISNGPVVLNTNARFAPVSGVTANVFLMAGLSGVPPCGITLNPNSGFGPGLTTLMYAPQACTVDLKSNTGISQGQILGGTVNFHHTAQFAYSRLTVPGTGAGGYKQDVVYKREVVTT
jgi:hypothetical protein